MDRIVVFRTIAGAYYLPSLLYIILLKFFSLSVDMIMMPRIEISHFQPNKSDYFLSQCTIEKKFCHTQPKHINLAQLISDL